MPIILADKSDTQPNVIAAGRSGFYFAERVYNFLKKNGFDDFSLLPMEKYDDEKGVHAPAIYNFADGQPHVELPGNVRGRNVYVVQCFDKPTEYNPDIFSRDVVELGIILQAIKFAHGEKRIFVTPYYPGRGDKKDEPRSDIFAKYLADALESNGATAGLTMDLHAGQIQGFFDIPVDQLYASPVFIMYLKGFCKEQGISYDDIKFASTDAGGTKPTRRFSRSFYGKNDPRAGIAHVDKERIGTNESSTNGIQGNVNGKIVIFREDIGDTFGTLEEASNEAYAAGARYVIACVTHLLMNPKNGIRAEDRITRGGFKVITTNTTPIGEKYLREGHPDITVLDVTPLFTNAIARGSKGDGFQPLLTEGLVTELYQGVQYYNPNSVFSLPASVRSGGNHHDDVASGIVI